VSFVRKHLVQKREEVWSLVKQATVQQLMPACYYRRSMLTPMGPVLPI